MFGGLSVVSAFNISQTIAGVFNVAFIAMGSATAIIMGQKLGEWGESRVTELKDEAWKLTSFSVFSVYCISPFNARYLGCISDDL